MDWFRPLGIAGLAWRSVANVADRSSVWAPALIVGAAQLLVLLMLQFFYVPPLVPLAGPLVRVLGGETATHFPAHVLALPDMFDRACLVLEVLLAWVALGAATVRFASAFGVAQPAGAWDIARRSAGALTAIVGIGVLARLGLATLLAASPLGARLGSWGGLASHQLAGVLVQAALAYAAAFLLLRERGIWTAVSDSFALARRNVATTLILVAAPAVLLMPLSITARLLTPFAPAHPELIAGALALRVMVGVLAAVVAAGSITRLFLSKTRTAR